MQLSKWEAKTLLALAKSEVEAMTHFNKPISRQWGVLIDKLDVSLTPHRTLLRPIICLPESFEH